MNAKTKKTIGIAAILIVVFFVLLQLHRDETPQGTASVLLMIASSFLGSLSAAMVVFWLSQQRQADSKT